jgi:hypothetical protein
LLFCPLLGKKEKVYVCTKIGAVKEAAFHAVRAGMTSRIKVKRK